MQEQQQQQSDPAKITHVSLKNTNLSVLPEYLSKTKILLVSVLASPSSSSSSG